MTSRIITTDTMTKTVITTTGTMMIGAVKIATITIKAAITGMVTDQEEAGTGNSRI
jgi:hypothetical protein